MADFDLSSLQGLLGSLGPTDADRQAARQAALLQLGASLLGARRGQEWDRVGYGLQNGLGAYYGQLQAGPKQRMENLKGVMELQKVLKDAQMQDAAMKLISGGGTSSIPEQAGPPSPGGQSATYAPAGGGMPYSPAAEQGWAILNPKVADVLHRQNEITQGPQGTLIRNGQIVGQVLENGMVVNGQFTPLPQEALDLKATQAARQAAAVETATQQAKVPYNLITGPYGPNGAQSTRYQLDAVGAPPGGAAQAADPIASIMPRNEQEAAQLTTMMGQRGLGARYVQQGNQFVPGPGHGTPLVSQGGGAVGPDPLRIRAAEGQIGAQTAQDTKIAEAQGGDYVGILQAEKQAPNNIGKLELLKSHLAKVGTGKVAPATMTLKAYASYFAPDLAKDWTKDVPYAQAAAALSNEMALQLRNPTGGAGMPGSLSDSDRNFLTSMSANAANDPRAIPLMIDARIALEKRSQEVGKLARDYRAANGKIDDGFYAVLSQYSATHPLFQQQAPQAAPLPAGGPLTAAEQAELQQLRKRFGR